MGVLSDIVAADSDAGAKILAADVPSEVFGGEDVKGIQFLQVAALHRVILGTSDGDQYEEVEGDSDGPWVVKLAEELTASLAELRDDECESVVVRWSADDELVEFDTDTLLDYLHAFRRVCRDGKARGLSVWLWVSL